MGHTHPLSLEWEKNDLSFDMDDAGMLENGMNNGEIEFVSID